MLFKRSYNRDVSGIFALVLTLLITLPRCATAQTQEQVAQWLCSAYPSVNDDPVAVIRAFPSNETFTVSSTTERIDDFVSHDWKGSNRYWSVTFRFLTNNDDPGRRYAYRLSAVASSRTDSAVVFDNTDAVRSWLRRAADTVRNVANREGVLYAVDADDESPVSLSSRGSYPWEVQVGIRRGTDLRVSWRRAEESAKLQRFCVK